MPKKRQDIEFTGRELEVLIHIGEGDTAKEISQRLGISSRTVEGYTLHLFRRLRAHYGMKEFTRTHLAIYAISKCFVKNQKFTRKWDEKYFRNIR